jgi:FtsP/CotA-like multicopper oxidase with cupredoxin domain
MTRNGVTIARSEPSRRSLLAAAGGAAIASILRPGLVRATTYSEKTLVAADGRVRITPEPYPQTGVWCYDGSVPGPEIRLRQGGFLRVSVENRLAQDTTVHWHGLRIPNAMDGAPYVTQPPIQPEENFVYQFIVPDAGTYWYHPHAHSADQVGRGLMGALIIEEPQPPPVDRDVVWVLGDFRLNDDASIAGGFGNRMEMSMSGRIGNTVTINGRVPDRFPVRSGERIRLRLINAAPARIFGLDFRDHRPLVVAFDGQPVEPHAPVGGRIVLGPAMRTDLILDMTGKPGQSPAVLDTFYKGLEYKLVEISYTGEQPLRAQPLAAPAKLPPNPIPEPALAKAQRHDVTLTGGMMGGGMMSGGMMGGGMMGGSMWAINGIAVINDDMRHMKPVLTLARGKSYIVAIDNQTAWHHPMHLHGHSFRVITRNGAPTKYQEWRDTVLVPPRERAEIAFVADNPGDWMFHCHILDHQEGGMMSIIRVA